MNNKIQIDFNKLSFYLKLKKLNINKLAELLNVRRQTVYHWKKVGTTLDNVLLICHFLEIKQEDIT